jgi:hypothetical protein
MAEKVAQSNPITYVRTAAALPAFAIAHGTGDCLVPVGQSQILASALTAGPETGSDDPGRRRARRSPVRRPADGPTIRWLTTALGR